MARMNSIGLQQHLRQLARDHRDDGFRAAHAFAVARRGLSTEEEQEWGNVMLDWVASSDECGAIALDALVEAGSDEDMSRVLELFGIATREDSRDGLANALLRRGMTSEALRRWVLARAEAGGLGLTNLAQLASCREDAHDGSAAFLSKWLERGQRNCVEAFFSSLMARTEDQRSPPVLHLLEVLRGKYPHLDAEMRIIVLAELQQPWVQRRLGASRATALSERIRAAK